MKNRREFIQLAGMGLMAASIPDFLKLPAAAKHRLAVQLYTIRDAISKDYRASLKHLADLGFKNVETAFWPENVSVATAADTLKEFGFNVTSCHVDMPTKDNIAKLVSTAKAYGCNKLIWHGWPEDKRYSSLAGTKELVKLYNESYKLAKDHGLHFGLHNHWCDLGLTRRVA